MSLEKEYRDGDLSAIRLLILDSLETRKFVDHYSNANRDSNVTEVDRVTNKLIALEAQMALTSPRDYLYTKDAKTGKPLVGTYNETLTLSRSTLERIRAGYQPKNFATVLYEGGKKAADDATEGALALVIKTLKALLPFVGIIAVVLIAGLIFQKKVR